MTLHHWLLACRPVLDRVEAHFDPNWEAFLREPGDKACFWRACLVPVGLASQFALPSEDLVCTGVFEVWPVVTDGLFFGGDASGCPYTKDARLKVLDPILWSNHNYSTPLQLLPLRLQSVWGVV